MPGIEVPEYALQFGFDNVPIGTHGSRTLMLAELRTLLSGVPPLAGLEEYRSAVVRENIPLKHTTAGRRATFRALRELYGLSQDVLLFRALRDLWDADPAAQPLLALLCATARDPILWATADTVLDTKPGEAVTPQQLAHAVAERFPGRYKSGVLDHMGRNTASTWQQSGHLAGRQKKVRSAAASAPTSVAYGLLLGHLCGDRGEGLLTTRWARLRDTPVYLLRERASMASQRGWIDYRYSGAVTDVGFSHLLRDVEVDG